MEVMELLLRGNDEWYWGTLAPRQAAEPHFEDALPYLTSPPSSRTVRQISYLVQALI